MYRKFEPGFQQTFHCLPEVISYLKNILSTEHKIKYLGLQLRVSLSPAPDTEIRAPTVSSFCDNGRDSGSARYTSRMCLLCSILLGVDTLRNISCYNLHHGHDLVFFGHWSRIFHKVHKEGERTERTAQLSGSQIQADCTLCLQRQQGELMTISFLNGQRIWERKRNNLVAVQTLQEPKLYFPRTKQHIAKCRLKPVF